MDRARVVVEERMGRRLEEETELIFVFFIQ
jgi:hypothetical protein